MLCSSDMIKRCIWNGNREKDRVENQNSQKTTEPRRPCSIFLKYIPANGKCLRMLFAGALVYFYIYPFNAECGTAVY
jgi:hypothetical protein